MKNLRDKLLKILLVILAGVSLYVFLYLLFSATTAGMNSEIPPPEQAYIDDTLSKITHGLSEDEVIEILGPPSRSLPYKLNWWVTIAGKPSRVGVIFSFDDYTAKEIILDGGSGRFYYRKDLFDILPR